MTYLEFIKKHATANRIYPFSIKTKNMKFYYWDSEDQLEKVGYFLKERSDIDTGFIEFEVWGWGDGWGLPSNKILDIKTNYIFRVTKESELKCTCGAKFTSNPNFHLKGVCDLEDKK